jgi:hypothetical protein
VEKGRKRRKRKGEGKEEKTVSTRSSRTPQLRSNRSILSTSSPSPPSLSPRSFSPHSRQKRQGLTETVNRSGRDSGTGSPGSVVAGAEVLDDAVEVGVGVDERVGEFKGVAVDERE